MDDRQQKIERVTDALAALRVMKRDGALDDATYHKMLVGIATDYASLEDLESAVAVLHGIPGSYFGDVQEQQMREDPLYAKQAQELAQKLVEAGLVDSGPRLVFTQGPAQA